MRTLTGREKRLLLYLAVIGGILGWRCIHARWSPQGVFETEHYRIESSATEDQTRETGQVAEIVYEGYGRLLDRLQITARPHEKLKLRLFKDREEFRRCNPGCGWAEAFYRRPCCYQYYSADEAHPYHWMMHEATHQLNAEVACLSLPQWLDEGLACYVGTSRIVDRVLCLGRIDTNAYPVWWLDSMELSGDLDADRSRDRVISLRAIVSGQGGPNLNRHFNLYYLHWWSLAHFLMEWENGRHRAGLARVIAAGGTLTAFEEHVGRIEDVERQWYDHLRDLRRRVAAEFTPPVRLGTVQDESSESGY